MSYVSDIEKIASALDAAEEVLADFTPGAIVATKKAGGDPLTEADTAVNAVISNRPRSSRAVAVSCLPQWIICGSAR